MEEMVKLKIDKDINIQDFEGFLDFHQVDFESSKDDVLNFSTLEKETVNFISIPADRLEEMKVMILVYKDLVSNQDQRSLNISIENSTIDYERTRKFNIEEGIIEEEDEGEPFLSEGLFVKASSGEAPTEKDMEDSFYGYAKKKKAAGRVKSDEEIQDFNAALMEDFETEVVEKSNLWIDILKIILLMGFAGILVAIYILIR